MGVRRYFSRRGNVDISLILFQVVKDAMQIDLHKTLYPFNTTKKIHHESTRSIQYSGVRRKFSWGFPYGGHLYLMCAVCDVTSWRRIPVSKPTFRRCAEYKLSALQVRISEENKLNAATQQFITAKISGCPFKQGNKALITASEQISTGNFCIKSTN